MGRIALVSVFTLALLAQLPAFAGSFHPDTTLTYRESPTRNLYFYYPKTSSQEKRPALILFFGGAWSIGSPQQFEPQAEYLSKYGIVVVLADYRTKSNAGTTPVESLKDAKSAMRFLKLHADAMGIDSSKIAAGGGSAGGQLAAATAFCPNINDSEDDLAISSVPQALVLYNPAIDNGPGGVGYESVKTCYLDFSPLHNIKSWVPPTIFFLGTADELIPVETALLFKERAEKAGGRCDLKLYPGQKHGFFNKEHSENFEVTMKETVFFFKSLGYIKE